MKIALSLLIYYAVKLASPAASNQWRVVWTENFDTLDRSKWEIEVNCNGGGNNELQCYTDRPSNVMVKDGQLILKAIPEDYQNRKYTSGRIKQISDGFLYGKMEARAKLPAGKHLWPAFWMLPQQNVYGGWAASGEIDIMEYRGQVTNKVEGTLHFGGAWPNNVFEGSGPKTFPFDLSKDFHVYAVEWEPDQIRWYLDGQQYHAMTLNRSFWSGKGKDPYNGRQRAPFDQKFRFILNLAVGGNFFPSNVYGNLMPGEARQWSNPEFRIDWIRVSQR